MKKPLTQFFTTRSVKNHFNMLINKTKEWLINTFPDDKHTYTLCNMNTKSLYN